MARVARILASFLLLAPVAAQAQGGGMQHDHAQHAQHAAAPPAAASAPALGGQAAFVAVAEVVRQLDADSTTDWSKVNLEALRQHLVDMDDVTLRSVVRQRPVEGGVEVDVTGAGRVRDAARRMVTAHARVLDAMPDLAATAAEIPEGVRLTVRAKRPDARAVARLRGLGFVGLLALGDHHAMHHLMIARGGGHH